MKILRLGILLLTMSSARAQIPGMFPWWEAPMRKDLGLSIEQNRQINATLRETRPNLVQLRGTVESAEAGLKEAMDAAPVDSSKVNEAIEKVVAARAELMRAVAQMSLKLRLILTPEQWQELQKRQPAGGGRRSGPRGPGMRGSASPAPAQERRPPESYNH